MKIRRVEIQETNDTVRLVLDGTPIAELLGTQLQKLKRACTLAAAWNQRQRAREDAAEELTTDTID